MRKEAEKNPSGGGRGLAWGRREMGQSDLGGSTGRNWELGHQIGAEEGGLGKAAAQ